MVLTHARKEANDQPVPVTPEEGRETVRILEMIVRKLEA